MIHRSGSQHVLPWAFQAAGARFQLSSCVEPWFLSNKLLLPKHGPRSLSLGSVISQGGDTTRPLLEDAGPSRVLGPGAFLPVSTWMVESSLGGPPESKVTGRTWQTLARCWGGFSFSHLWRVSCTLPQFGSQQEAESNQRAIMKGLRAVFVLHNSDMHEFQ